MRRTVVPGDLVWVVARGDEHYGDIGTVYAIPDEDDVIVEFEDVSEGNAFRHYELKAIGANEITDSSSTCR
jgi:hypothetical protein